MAAGATGVIEGGAARFLRQGRRLEVGGTLAWTGGELVALETAGTIAVLPGGVWEVSGPTFRDNCFETVTVENDGLIRKVGPGGTTLGGKNPASGLVVGSPVTGSMEENDQLITPVKRSRFAATFTIRSTPGRRSTVVA